MLLDYPDEDIGTYLMEECYKKQFRRRKNISRVPTISYGVFLTEMTREFKRVPDEITNSIKFNDHGDGVNMILQLRKTMNGDKVYEEFVKLERELHRQLSALLVSHGDLERENKRENGKLRTQLFLSQNQVWAKEQEISEIRKKMKANKVIKEEIWNDVMQSKDVSERKETLTKEMSSRIHVETSERKLIQCL